MSLIRESSTATSFPAVTGSSDLPAETPAVSSKPIYVSVSPTAPSSLVLSTGQPNATYSGPSPPEFTGGAAKFVGGGMAILAGAVGLVFV